jgi:hypothetical protein
MLVLLQLLLARTIFDNRALSTSAGNTCLHVHFKDCISLVADPLIRHL